LTGTRLIAGALHVAASQVGNGWATQDGTDRNRFSELGRTATLNVHGNLLACQRSRGGSAQREILMADFVATGVSRNRYGN